MAKKKAAPIQLKLQIGEHVYTSEGATIEEALKSLERPKKLMYKATLTVTNGQKTTVQLLNPQRLKRFFYPVALKLHVKNLEAALK